MPNRIIRHGINDSRAVNTLTDSGEIFYRRLMTLVDDYGRYEADVELLRGDLFKRKLDTWPIDRVRRALAEVSQCLADDGQPLVIVYRAGVKNILQINNFCQRTRSQSRHPPPTPSDDGHVLDNVGSRAQPQCAPVRLSETETETETYKTSSRNGVSRMAGFDRFWSVVWRRVNKPGAVKAWPEALRYVENLKVPPEDPVEYLAEQALSESEKAAVPGNEWRSNLHPATWLRGHRWEDEVKPNQAPKSKSEALMEGL